MLTTTNQNTAVRRYPPLNIRLIRGYSPKITKKALSGLEPFKAFATKYTPVPSISVPNGTPH